MTVTAQQQRAIVFLAAACRPTGARRWDEAGIAAAVAKVADRSLPAVILAVIQAAEDRNANTPGVIPTAGPHWRAPDPMRPAEHTATDIAGLCDYCQQPEARCRSLWAGDHDYQPYVHAAALEANEWASGPVSELRDIVATVKASIPEEPKLEPLPTIKRSAGAEAARAAIHAAREPDPEPLLRPDEYTREPESTEEVA